MGKVLKRIVDVLFVLFIIALASYFLLRSKGILEIYKVETGSMENGIHVGDYVLICKKNNYVIGDIVTYRKEHYYITHRIIKSINGDRIVTKGDANNTEDEEINVNDIVGRVIYVGGLLNFAINYKYALVSLFLTLYLFSSYFTRKSDSDVINSKDVTDVEESVESIKEIKMKKYRKRKIHR